MKNKRVITALLLAGIMTFSACGKKEKTDKFQKYLSNGQYQEALDYSKEHDVDFDDYTDEIKEQADLVFNDYKEGKLKSGEAIAQLKILGNIAGEEGREYIKEIKSTIDDYEDAEYDFKTAEDYFNDGYYQYAIEYYDNIPEGTPHYEEAQEKLAQAEDKYLEKVFADADEYAEEGWFDSARSTLETAKNYVKNTDKIDEKLASYKDGEKDYRISDIEDSCDSWGVGRYDIEDILELMEDYPNDSDVKALYDKYVPLYVQDVIESADYYAGYDEYDYAIEEVEEALEVLPDNEELLAYLESLNGGKPDTFETISFTGTGFSKARSDAKDVKGYSYDMEDTIISDAGEDKEYTAEFKLDKKYSSFEADAAPVEGFKKDAKVKVEFICDDKVVTTVSFADNSWDEDIEIDVTGVSKLVIKVTPDGGENLKDTSVLVSDAYFRKAAEKADTTEEETPAEEATTTAAEE